MSRISIPLDVVTSRLNFSERFGSVSNIRSNFGNFRSLYEFFDVKRISKPANLAETQSRLNYNLSYFSSNYAAIFAMLGIYALLNNWWLLFFIALLVGGMYGIGRLQGNDLVIGNWHATTTQLYTTLVIIGVPVFFMSSPFMTVFWLLGSSALVILGHAAFLDKPIESAFSEEAV
ncbi:prenylated rab acceptor PRA1 [Microthyrium microscopicum]|uniref:PRA1 family protein n=1 Tax=Microthyrium microscopicum TaxID=703497 RepID=A0A6A6UQJ8_9PEZI|nr:prenylated rab acceptor PRA1 [Microthyrium microscopicum]